MRISHRFSGLLAALVLAGGAIASAAAPKIEGTPVPLPAKPDFSSMQYLLGTWTCSDLSSRRPRAFTITETYAMDPTGYWIVRSDTTHKESWIPREFHGQTRFGWDAASKKWIRISTDDLGRYAVATAPMPTGAQKTYTYTSQTTAPDIASYAPEVFTKVSNTKKTMTTSFTEKNGRVVNVKETCTKS